MDYLQKKMKPNCSQILYRDEIDGYAWEHLCDTIGAPYHATKIIIYFNDKQTDWETEEI